MKFVYKGKRFNFVRNNRKNESEGYWISDEQIGNHPPGIIVSRKLSSILSEEAIKAGLKERYNFAHFYVYPKTTAVGSGRVGRPKNSSSVFKIALDL